MSGSGYPNGGMKSLVLETFTEKVIICLTTIFGALVRMCRRRSATLSEALFIQKIAISQAIPSAPLSRFQGWTYNPAESRRDRVYEGDRVMTVWNFTKLWCKICTPS